MQKCRGFNSFLPLSKKTSHSRHGSSNQEKSHKRCKISQDVADMYQQTKLLDKARNKLCLYCEDVKYCRICLGSRRTIKQCPLMLQEVRTVEQGQRKHNLAKRSVMKCKAQYGMVRCRTIEKDGMNTIGHKHIKIFPSWKTNEQHWLRLRRVYDIGKAM